MKEGVNRQILLVEKPSGKLGLEHFRLVEGAMPKPSDGEVLVRVRYISLDAVPGCMERLIERRWSPTPSWQAEASPR